MNKLRSIILVGSFGDFAFETIYSRHLRSFGIEVHEFDIQEPFMARIHKNIINRVISKANPNYFCEDINRELIQFVKRKRPDIVLVFKGMQIYPSTIEEIKRHAHLLANYNPDHPFTYYSAGSGNMNIFNSLSLYDLHFSYSQNIVKKFIDQYNLRAYWVPFGYDESIQSVPSCDFSKCFLFVGAWDKERQIYLSNLKKFDIKIFGNSPWKHRTYLSPSVQRMYQNRPLLKGEYLFASKNAIGTINLLRPQNRIEQSHNMRTFEVPGYGGMLISERTEEQLYFFEENREAIYFSCAEELKNKLEYYFRNESEASRIKKAGLERSARSNYGYYHRVKQVLKILEAQL